MDELIEFVFQIIMDARNKQLQLDENGSGIEIGERILKTDRKDDPLPRGELVILTGSMDLTVKMVEQVLGLTGLAGDDVTTETQTASIDSETIDTETKTGVTVPVV